jgi:hypothetical protein
MFRAAKKCIYQLRIAVLFFLLYVTFLQKPPSIRRPTYILFNDLHAIHFFSMLLTTPAEATGEGEKVHAGTEH